MKKASCILCNHAAERSFFSNSPDPTEVAGEYKYVCSECGLFVLDNFEHNWIEFIASEKQKNRLSEYVKDNHAEEGNYKVIKWRNIKNILRLD